MDKAAFKRRNVRYVRIMGGAWIVPGAGAAVLPVSALRSSFWAY
jgi:hypothetical protein